MVKSTSNADFSLSQHLRSNLKVVLLGWEIKTDIVGEAKHSLWESNVKVAKYSPRSCRGKFLVLFCANSDNAG